MRQSERDKRKYFIIGLCMVLVIMTVGYAAFASNLTINSTSEVTSNWCVGFDSTIQNPYTAQAGITNGTVPTASITYNGNVCSGSYNTGVNLSATMKQPGDNVTYTLTIKNASSLDAAIESITVNNQNVVSNKEVVDGNVVFVVGMPESTSLSAGESTTMTVTARFQDEIDITGGYNGESANLTVKINASQDGGTGGFEKKFSGYIYRNNSNDIYLGYNIKTGEIYSMSTDDTYGHGPVGDYGTLEECELANTYGNDNLKCHLFTKSIGEYTTSQTEIQNDYNYYLKHYVVDDIIIESYSCFVMGEKEYCLKGYDTSAYEFNQSIIKKYQSFYNLNEISHPSPNNLGCAFSDFVTVCYSNNNGYVTASSTGSVISGTTTKYCSVFPNGNSSLGNSKC